MKIKRFLLMSICLGTILILANACNKDFGAGETLNYTNTVKEKVDTDPQFSMFKQLYTYFDSLQNANKPAVITAGTRIPVVGGTLGSNYITAFIPTNDAFLNNGVTFVQKNGLINPALIKYITRNNTATVTNPATLPIAILQQYMGNFFTTKFIAPTDLGSVSGVKSLGGTGGDSLYLFQASNGSYINVNTRIDPLSSYVTKNGNLYPVDNLVTPVFNGSFIQTLAIDTGLALFSQALVRAADASVTAASNGGTVRSTILAPNNQAMIAAGYTSTVITATPAATLAKLVKHHIYSKKIFSPNFTAGPLTMLDATNVTVTITTSPKFTSLNTPIAASIVTPDILCARAVIHKIDKVLKP